MFGYVICNKQGLSKDELARYQGFYCGLCRALRKRFGQFERLSLSYDMTFLALFLASLYEPEEEKVIFRCPVHPLQRKNRIDNKFIDYAADMTVILAYHKAIDDWDDEKKKISYHYSKILLKSYHSVKLQYPRQCKAVEDCLKEMKEIEKNPMSTADDAVNCCGRLMQELFVYKEDFWGNSLRSFGFELSKFIYLMDATIDYKKDLKSGNYNPLIRMNKKPCEMEPILSMTIGNATQIFEQMPFIQDENLIRNVLYGGVWQKYYAFISSKEK